MDDTYDVIVVGGGGSGLACAVSAAEQGASVLVLEKQPRLGGSTARAVGSFTASGTSYQRRAGIADDPTQHAADAALVAPPALEARDDHALRRMFFGEAGATLDWLAGLGIRFRGPSPEPPNRLPRMHNVMPSARAYIVTLERQLLRLGGTVVSAAPVEGLVQEGAGVTGVRARIGGRQRIVHARRGVVLAAGDYAGSGAMIARYRGAGFGAIGGVNPHATGDGHRLAEAAGARLVNMDITYGPELRFVPAPSRLDRVLGLARPVQPLLRRILPLVPAAIVRWLLRRLLVTWLHPEDALIADGAILVDRDGARFCDETASPEREIAVAARPGSIAYLVLDERLARRYSAWPHAVSTAPEIAYAYVPDYLRRRPDVALEGTTIEAVAMARGLPGATLRQTVEAYGGATTRGDQDTFGRTAGRVPLAGSRWVLLGPLRAYFTNTEGGVAIDATMRALDLDGRPIPGLYAVGQNGLGGMILWGHGLHIAWAMTSGRLAGRALGRTVGDATSAIGRSGA
jgi:succinate dehydrogenase/fumarate reductase flavoprotein subunit